MSEFYKVPLWTCDGKCENCHEKKCVAKVLFEPCMGDCENCKLENCRVKKVVKDISIEVYVEKSREEIRLEEAKKCF